MKKFTFMLLAAFFAVAAMAAGPEKRGGQALDVTAVMTSVTKQATPKTKAVKVQAPVKFNKLAQRAKAGAKKAAKKVSAEDLLSADWMLCSQYYEYNEEAGGLAAATPSAGGHPVTFQMVDEQTLAIGGFTSDAKAIQATFAMTTDEQLLAEGVIIEATIADGQILSETDYGPVLLRNLSAEEGTPIKAYIYEDGYVVFDAIWADMLGGDGQYAGSLWSGYYYSSYAVPVNGNMSWGENNAAVYIEQDPESPKNIKVYNFAGWETAINVTVKEDKTFVIDSQAVYDGGSTQGVFYTYGLSDDASSLISLTGVGTENTLTFDCKFTAYSSSGYWFGAQDPATITLLQGEFVYPVIEDVAAVPANPEVLAVGNYDAAQGYGYVSFTVPTTDVDGNDIKEANLFYQLFSDIEGDIQPIVFTPEVCEKLTEDMSIIPYTFTDNWDFADKGTYKVIFLNYNFNEMYDRIGLKSIYTGGGETNESEVVWADVEKPEPVGPTQATFNFNAMDVPTSSGVTTDGDINETVSFTESGVTLAISPKDASADTPNRFWSTKNGPQLRVYSGTLIFTAPEGSVITSIDFSNNAKWNEGNTADSGEFEDAVWTGSAQFVVVTIAGNSQINSIVVTIEEGEGGEEEDQIVVIPEGVTPIEYTLVANGADSESPIVIEETMLVAFDGSDVYLQGLAYYFPEAFVKGTLGEDSKVIVPSGQYLGEDNYGKEYLIALNGNPDEGFALEENIVFNYDAETGVFTLEGCYGESGTKDTSELFDYFDSAVYTPGALELPYVQLPDGVEPETWTLEGAYGNGMGSYTDQQIATEVAFDGADIYVKGLAYYFPDAWVKGTLDAETGIATFPASQFVGKDDYGREYMIGFDGQQTCDFQYAYDAQANTLTQLTPYILESSSETGLDEDGEITAWGLWINSQLYKGEPVVEEPVTIPDGLATETYLFKSNELIETEDDDDASGVAPFKAMSVRKAYELKEYSFQTQVGFDGNDVYIKGFTENTSDFWAKGTLSEDGQTVTIPANQYIGTISIETTLGTYTFPYYLTADEATSDEFADIVFNYDAETKSFATRQTLVVNGSKHVFYPYQTFSGATITKLEEFAATPADPAIESVEIEGVKYPFATFNIPVKDVDGNDLIASKLFYTIWVEKDGQTQPFTVSASEYRDVEEDMVEIPYEYNDNYDIYMGGSKFYFNPIDEPATWTKFGVQSIYYGANERHESNIVWVETGTGIASLAQDQKDAVIYNIAGQRVQKAQKGLYIVNGKKIVIK